MVKLYKRYEQQSSFGVITSGIVVSHGEECYASSLSDVVSFNIRKGTQEKTILKAEKLLTCIAKHSNIIAVGYIDGSIRLIGKQVVVLNGHRAPVTALAFDSTGTKLASGSSDTDIVLWDVVSEEGIFRFKGHKDQVTCLSFLQKDKHIVSGSKDSILKIWDIHAKCCVENIASHRGEIWTLAVSGDTILSGASDGVLRYWKIEYKVLEEKFKADKLVNNSESIPVITKAITLIDSIDRKSSDKILQIKYHSSLAFFAVQGSDKSIEIFKLKSESETIKSFKKRQKRALKKNSSAVLVQEVQDSIVSFCSVRCPSKIKSFDFVEGLLNKNMQLFVGLANNSIEVHEINSAHTQEYSRLVTSIEMQGHRSDIRAVTLNSDDSLIATGSADCIKIYSTKSMQCLHTLTSGYILCCAFLPGGQHVIAGTKLGELQLFDLSSGTLLENISAHDGAIWSMHILPDKSGIVTGSQDKLVKFWTFALVQDADYSKSKKRASVIHTRTLKLADDILSVRVSPDGKLLAVALLDLTVKIFYVDTLKFFLSLYGHKLPVVSMDISFDSRVIITASSDKTVKIWGLDFGDCHRSILAHEDAVMGCQFVWGTYHFFTASKDKRLKYFDGEKFEEISNLEGHFGEIWALAVGKYGNIVVTASHDKSIRIWVKTDDQFALEEEREQRIEKIYENMDLGDGKPIQGIGSQQEGVEIIDDTEESATKMTMESLKAGELLAEAIISWKQEKSDFSKYQELQKVNPNIAPPIRNPFAIKMGAEKLSPEAVDAIDSSLSSRILFFLLKFHHDEIVANRSLKPFLEIIRDSNSANLKASRDRIGFNVYGLTTLIRDGIVEQSFFQEESQSSEPRQKRKLKTCTK